MTEHRQEIYVDTISKCQLTLHENYSLSCCPPEHRVIPETADFDDSYEDYSPTFQVHLSHIEPIELYLHDSSEKRVWYSYINLPAHQKGGVSPEYRPSSPYTPPGQDFFHKHKAALEVRLGLLRPILAELETCRVLNSLEREEVESKDSRPKQNQALLLMLKNKGGHAQEEFYRVLKKLDEYLVKDLERPHDYRTSA